MTQPPKSEQDLIHEIRETWQSPKMTTYQSAQFKRDLHQRLSRPLPKKPRLTSWNLALCALLLVTFGMATLSSWTTGRDTDPSSNHSQTDQTLLEILAADESSWDDNALPDDYVILSQLID